MILHRQLLELNIIFHSEEPTTVELKQRVQNMLGICAGFTSIWALAELGKYSQFIPMLETIEHYLDPYAPYNIDFLRKDYKTIKDKKPYKLSPNQESILELESFFNLIAYHQSKQSTSKGFASSDGIATSFSDLRIFPYHNNLKLKLHLTKFADFLTKQKKDVPLLLSTSNHVVGVKYDIENKLWKFIDTNKLTYSEASFPFGHLLPLDKLISKLTLLDPPNSSEIKGFSLRTSIVCNNTDNVFIQACSRFKTDKFTYDQEDVSLTTNNESTLLHYLIRYETDEARSKNALELIARKKLSCDSNKKDADGHTAFFYAFIKQNLSLMRLLHRLGSSYNAFDSFTFQGLVYTPISYAIHNDYLEIVKFFIEYETVDNEFWKKIDWIFKRTKPNASILYLIEHKEILDKKMLDSYSTIAKTKTDPTSRFSIFAIFSNTSKNSTPAKSSVNIAKSDRKSLHFGNSFLSPQSLMPSLKQTMEKRHDALYPL